MVELMVSISILGLLLALILPAVQLKLKRIDAFVSPRLRAPLGIGTVRRLLPNLLMGGQCFQL